MNANDYFRMLRDRQVTIVVDDVTSAPRWSSLGDVKALADHDLLAEHERPALIVALRGETVGRLHETWEDALCEFTYLSPWRHDAGVAAVRHAVASLGALAGAEALARRTERYEALLSCSGCDVLSSSGTLRVSYGDELEIANMSDEVRPQWLQAVTEFMEASVVNLERDGSSFSVDGVFGFDGLAYLFNAADVRDRHGEALSRLMRAAAGGHNRLEVAENRVVRVILGGSDATAEFVALFADDERGATVLEQGFGCAALTPDWTIDSPLHKCSRGVFLGIGTGHRGPHVDLVATGAEVRFVEQGPE